MHLKFITAAMLGMIVGTAAADEFYLRHDDTGKEYGPYQSKAGSQVQIGKTTFTVVQKSKRLSAVEKELMAVRIPTINFKDAPLQDVVKFLREQTQTHDPQKIGVNFIVRSHPRKISDPVDTGPRVTLSMTKVSALQVLEMLMTLTDHSYNTSISTGPKGNKFISENTVVISPNG